MCRNTGYYTWGRLLVWFGTYNIRNGHNRGLASALRGVSYANLDLGIFQDTKITDRVYTCKSVGYSGVTVDVPR